MAAILTSTGINFSDATVLNSKYGIVPQSSSMVFYQSAAPTGWTKQTGQNNKMLRIVSGTGGGSGGVNAFTSAFSSFPISANVPVTINGFTTGNTSLSVNTIPQHAHPANSGGNVGGGPGGPARVQNSGGTGNYGNSGGHAHPVSYSSANGPINTSLDMRVQYIDVIYCTFN